MAAAEAFRGGNKIKVAKRGSAQAEAESPKSRKVNWFYWVKHTTM